MYVLLVEPDFPYPTKSKHRANPIHKNFAPVSLLKLGAYYKSQGYKAKLVRGNASKKKLQYKKPKKILITSLFTYWSKYVWDAVKFYREQYPNSEIWIGGIYVTLHHNTKEFRKKVKKFRVKFHVGLHMKAESYLPDYSLIGPINYHVTHAMRGCIRRCKFCGVWKIEPKMMAKNEKQLIEEIKAIGKNKVIFYDNNFFANPYVKKILEELAKLRINGRPVTFESQSGFDGRLLEKDPSLAKLIKKARFSFPRIAWDHGFNDARSIKKEVSYLVKAGYPRKDIYVFMIYNFDIPFEIMVKKLKYCKRLKVQIVDCRYRPLDAVYDDYNSHTIGQTEKDYYIHKKGGWSDGSIRSFRRMVRQHNIGIRYGKDGNYIRDMEKRYHPIKMVFKAFGIASRAPKLEKYDKSKQIQNKFKILKSAYLYCKKNQIECPDLSDFRNKQINEKLFERLLKIKLPRDTTARVA